jgi:hypothetical protein
MTVGCWKRRWFGAQVSLDEPPRSIGNRHGMVAGTITETSSRFWSPAVVLRGDVLLVRRMRLGAEVAERPVYLVDLLGSIYALAGIDYTAMLPHPEGLEARVLPEPSDRVKSNGLLTEIM